MRAFLAAVLVVTVAACADEQAAEDAAPETIAVTSPAFADGEEVPVAHTCDGHDVPPALAWDAVPSDAAEIAVLVDDPDAPGGTFVHWLVAGLPPDVSGIEDGLPPSAVQGVNDFGSEGWAGPCPPPGDEPHAYRFRVLALGEPSGLTDGFSADDLDDVTADHLLAEGVVTGRYGR